MESLEKAKRKSAHKAIKEFLKEDYLEIIINKFAFSDNFQKKASIVRVEFVEKEANETRTFKIRKQGNGAIDALFKSLLKHYSRKYKSLNHISFKGFEVSPDFKKTKTSGSDAMAEVKVVFSDSADELMTFYNKNSSVLSATVLTIVKAFEFYINYEKAYSKLKILIEDAKDRDRGDLLQRYTYQLSCIINHEIIVE